MLAATSTNFLIPNWTLVAELIVFLIVVGVMAKVVLPPLTKAIEGRAGLIRGEMQRAEGARGEGEKATRDRRAVLAEARAEARGLTDAATKNADEARQEARARAQEEYGRMLVEARGSIETDRALAQEDLVSDLGALVVAAAEQVIRTEVDPGRHEVIIAEAVASARALGNRKASS